MSDAASEAPSAGPGHNSGTVSTGGVAGERLRSFLERIERLEAEKKELGGDIKEIYSEAKGAGFDTKIMRQLIRLRKMEVADRREQDELLEIYRRAVDC
jgi:uncharacterized protein (UPF0335 family)